jgi:hypothetical protein
MKSRSFRLVNPRSPRCLCGISSTNPYGRMIIRPYPLTTQPSKFWPLIYALQFCCLAIIQLPQFLVKRNLVQGD